MANKIVEYLLSEGEAPAAPESDDFDKDLAKETWATPASRTYVNLSDDIWGDEALLKRAFTWLTKTQIGPKFGNLPIGWYQQDQIAALNRLKELADKRGVSLKQVRYSDQKVQGRDASGRWLTFAVKPWHSPGMGLQEPHVKEDNEDEDDWKDVVAPPDEIIPENPSWWRYRNSSKWKFLLDPGLDIYTEMQQEDAIHLNQIKIPFGSSGSETNLENVPAAFEALVLRAAAGAISRIIVTLFLGDGYDEMQQAIDLASSKGIIQNVRRSGMAVYADIANSRPRWFRESDEDADFEAEEAKEVYGPNEDPEHTLAEIKSMVPGFFDRATTRWHGTRKVYKYRGNFIVLKNCKVVRRQWGDTVVVSSWPIYRWKRTEDRPDGDLFCIAHADDLDDAKRMIKTGDFRSRKERYGDRVRVGEAVDPDQDDARDIWADTSDIESFPKGTRVRVYRPGAMVHGVEAEVVKSTFDKVQVRVSPENWDAHGLIGEPQDLVLPLSEVDTIHSEMESIDDEDDEVREIFGRVDAQVLRQTQYLQLIKTPEGKYFLEVTFDAHPKRAELTERDVADLMRLNDSSFNSAAVMDFGVGVYQGPGDEEEEEYGG